jgi:hypothetical protein
MKKSIVLSCFLVLILNGLKSQTVEVPYSDYDLNCSLKTDSNKVIIRNKQELFHLTNCNEIIDFKRYILVGVHGAVGGCGIPKVEFKVTMDMSPKKYLIKSTVFQFGYCRRNNLYKRFILLEKPSEDYDISFDLHITTISE